MMEREQINKWFPELIPEKSQEWPTVERVACDRKHHLMRRLEIQGSG